MTTTAEHLREMQKQKRVAREARYRADRQKAAAEYEREVKAVVKSVLRRAESKAVWGEDDSVTCRVCGMYAEKGILVKEVAQRLREEHGFDVEAGDNQGSLRVSW